MKKALLLFTLLMVLLARNQATAQKALNPYSTKKLIIIPATADSSAGKDDSSGSKDFCICKIIAFNSENSLQRTDAIFASSSSERPMSKKELLRHIDYELQQALVFFDSYKLIKQFGAPMNCKTLYKYLKEQQEEIINRSTFLLSSYASR
jgi:hypothetical protein